MSLSLLMYGIREGIKAVRAKHRQEKKMLGAEKSSQEEFHLWNGRLGGTYTPGIDPEVDEKLLYVELLALLTVYENGDETAPQNTPRTHEDALGSNKL